MVGRNHFRTATTFTLIGNVTYAAAQLGILIVLARLTSPEDVGRYTLALAIAAPLQLGLGMRLRTARVVNDPEIHPLGAYHVLAIVSGLLAISIAALLGIALPIDSATTLTIWLVAFSKFIESLIDISYGESQRLGKARRIAVSQVCRGLLTICAAGVGAWFWGVNGAAAAIGAIWLVMLIVLDTSRRREPSRSRIRVADASALAAVAWPLGLAGALTSFISASPKYVLGSTLTTADVGIFSVLMYPTIVVSLFANSLGQAHLSSMSASVKEGAMTQFRQSVTRMLLANSLVGLIAIVALVAFGTAAFTFVFGAPYGDKAGIGAILAVAATLGGLATVGNYVLSSLAEFKVLPRVLAITAVLGIPIVFLFTMYWGMPGTACGMVVVLGMQCLFTALPAWRHARSRFLSTSVVRPSIEGSVR